MKNIFISLLAAASLFMGGCCCGNNAQQVIETQVPARTADQECMLGYVAPKLETVRVGFIGLGMRGPGAVERFTHIPGTQIVALCDLDSAKVARCQSMVERAGRPVPAAYYGDRKSVV